ncbi:MAG: bifunctional 5,10-methylenetetrahydrofolate dehydrogenase/5,10-methenyltetrahydrofolate cyclohydrolase, partial [Patescibacteria group bacterium]
MPTNNFLDASGLLERLEKDLVSRVKKLAKPPILALVWVGDDKQTQKFVKAKQKKAGDIGVGFQIHHFEKIEQRQLSALISSLNASKLVDGIIIQLPLPKNIPSQRIIEQISEEKDVDGLALGNFPAPTPTGIVMILKESGTDLAKSKTVILGGGRLVGEPLAKIFKQNNWPFSQITSRAEDKIDEIKLANVLIGATGVAGLIDEKMVGKNMVVVDGSGVDVNIEAVAGNV